MTKWQLGGLVVAAAALFLAVIYPLVNYSVRTHGQPSQAGVSFSIKQAHHLGLNWRETYLAIVDDLKPQQLRLMSYWDDLELSSGSIIFTDLDWQLDEAAKRDIKVTLALGQRQPRYPECHIPDWADNLDAKQRQQRLEDFIRQVVERYRQHPALASYQLENEAFNRSFGECGHFTPDQLKAEYNLVKQLDEQHPVVISVSNQGGIPLRSPRGDQVGFSIYRWVYNRNFYNGYFTYPLPAWWHRLRAAWIATYLNRPVMIHELQAEPWGPKPTPELTLAEQDRTMPVEHIGSIASYARRTGIKQFDLWGAEWWYWRKLKHADPGPWEAARAILE